MSAPLTVVVYGKGGVGKSTMCAHLAVAFAQAGRKVLLLGCDPKADTSLRLLGGERPPTIVDMVTGLEGRAFRDLVVRARPGLDVLETGGPPPGMGCGGRSVATLCQFLEEHAREVSAYDTLVFDVLGDLVCGGFVAPLRFGFGRDVYVVSSAGGEPTRLTYHPSLDRARGWTPDGKRVIFGSNRVSVPHNSYFKLWSVPVEGGPADALPMPRAYTGALSPDGKRIAYEEFGRELVVQWQNISGWRHYRGGRTHPVRIMTLADHADEIATMWASFDTEVPEGDTDLRQVIGQTVGAIIQVASTGTPDQRAKAVAILAETRRKLYGLLAEGPDADSEE